MDVSELLNGAPVLKLEEVVIGSQLNIAINFEKLISSDPDVFEPVDFTGKTIQADIKLKVKEATVLAEFECTPRLGGGWVDFHLGGDVTLTLPEKTLEASVKVWPTADPTKGDTLAVIILPMKYKATR